VTVEMQLDGVAVNETTVAVNASTVTVRFCWTAVKGNHTITIRVAATGGVTETDLDNNNASREISVLKAPAPQSGQTYLPIMAVAAVILIFAAMVVILALRRARRNRGPPGK